MIKLMIFDLDGTLSNTLASIAHFGNTALRECGYSEVESVDDFRYLVGNGADALMRGMLRTVAGQANEPEVQRLRQAYDRAYAQDPFYLVEQYDGVLKTLLQLHRDQILLAVLSNKPHDIANRVVTKLFQNVPFARCYGQRDGVARKPSPEGALLIARELGVLPQDCVYVGDTDVDMKTGKAAGMYTAGVLWGFRDASELISHGADCILSHPSELLALPGISSGAEKGSFA